MKSKKLIKILSAALAVMSLAFINPSAASADWKSDSNGWWNSNGDSWSVGWEKIDGEWYYFESDGYMVTGWKQIEGKWYYFAEDGTMSIGLVKSGDSDYLCDETGAMITGWKQYGGEWHYYSEDGSAKTGWLLDNSNWYYINKGLMIHDDVVDGYELNSDGVWTQEEPESEEAVKAKDLIYKNDGDFIEKIKQYDFKLGRAEETTIKEFTGADYNIPDEKCFKISASVNANGTKMETIYLVGKESGKVYGSAKLDNYSMYEFKDNKIAQIFYCKNDEAGSIAWHYSTSDPVEDNMYLNRKFVEYDGKFISISTDDIKSKSSINTDDAIELAMQADGKKFYVYTFRNGIKLQIKKGKEIDIKDITDGKWDMPKGDYYGFEVVDNSNPEEAYTAYYYMVNKKTKDVYLVPNEDTLNAYKIADNEKTETYKWLKGDQAFDWR